jgi:hypothetical protein
MSERLAGGVRLSRYELPGKRWYFASCHQCQWVGLDWRHKDMAQADVKMHNEFHHSREAG